VTLELTPDTTLSQRFAENVGSSPVLFFVRGRLEPSGSAASGEASSYHVFDLPGGYRIGEPATANLLVQVELTEHPGLALDMVPSREARFLLAEDLKADSGRLLHESPVVCLWTRPATAPGARPTEPRETRSPDALIARGPSVAELEQKVARLESLVHALTSARAWPGQGSAAAAVSDSIDLDVSTLFAESGRQVGTTGVITTITPVGSPHQGRRLRPVVTTPDLTRLTSPYGVPTADEWLSESTRRFSIYRPSHADDE
jgi:hypothetical protein